jgi:hypothetical protein
VWSIGVGGNLPVDSAIFLGMSGAAIGIPGFTSRLLTGLQLQNLYPRHTNIY